MNTSKTGSVKNLILGIDPGTTTGIALLDLKSRIILLKSARVLSKSDIVSIASSYGKVILVATDRVHPPKLVTDIARTFGAKLFRQDLEFSYRDKLKTVTAFLSTTNEVPADEHQVSALFGALKAFKAYKNRLEEVTKVLDSLKLHDKGFLEEQLRACVMRGLSISRALKSVLPMTTTPDVATQYPKASSSKSPIINSEPQKPTTGYPKVSVTVKKKSRPHVIRHPQTVIVPSSERRKTEDKAETPVKKSESSTLEPYGGIRSLPEGLRVVKFIGVITRKRIKELIDDGMLSHGDIVYGSRVSDDLEKVSTFLKKAGVSVVILEELDDSSVLQMMNENVVPISKRYVSVVQKDTEMLVDGVSVKEAIKRTEARYREMLLNLISDL